MKIRTGFVSNSSSSSFVIACKGEKCVNQVREAYGKLTDYWIETNPSDEKENFLRIGYSQLNAENIVKKFENHILNDEEEQYLLKLFKEKEKEGYTLLLGNCSNEYCYPEYKIMNMFNEYVLNSLKDENDKYLDAEMIFERRWG